MPDCIFCAIVAGEIPSRTVYEDDDVVAFLDANPLAPGHTVIIPTDHHQHLSDLPDELATHIYDVVHDLVPDVEGAVDAPASNVGINNGEAAGQEIPHVHFHIVPRFEGDGGHPFHAIMQSPADLSDDEMDDIAERIVDRR